MPKIEEIKNMNHYTLKTNINCENCIRTVTPFLNENKNIKSWNVNTLVPEKTLQIEAEYISVEDIKNIISNAGFVATEHTILNTKNSFWNDIDKWKRAAFNTLNCLVGCSIGDFLMVIFLQHFYPAVSMSVQMILATTAGLCTSILLETIILKKRENFDWNSALKTAFSMSFISMIAMELAMNTTDFMITGGKANFGSAQYWLAFIPSLVAGFLVPLPYNYFKLKKYNKACH